MIRISTSIDANDPAFRPFFFDCELSFQIASSYGLQGVRSGRPFATCLVAPNYSVQISSKLLAVVPSSAMQTNPVWMLTGHRFFSENSEVLTGILKYFQTTDVLRPRRKLSTHYHSYICRMSSVQIRHKRSYRLTPLLF